tara:strand:+ start:7115 stop:8416 length:1302 start_codon:yes stop_codon:yes gene_type:complete
MVNDNDNDNDNDSNSNSLIPFEANNNNENLNEINTANLINKTIFLQTPQPNLSRPITDGAKEQPNDGTDAENLVNQQGAGLLSSDAGEQSHNSGSAPGGGPETYGAVTKDVNLSEQHITLQKLVDLELNVKEKILRIHKHLTLIRYKYEYYDFWNTFMNMIIILCSSIITFLESLRANLPDSAILNFWFTIITLSLGFIIALSMALYKFLKIQDKMELIKSGIITMESPYKDFCQFSDKLKRKIKEELIDTNNKKMEDVYKLWEELSLKIVYPMMNVDNILLQGEYYNYERRYIEQHNKSTKMRQKKDIMKLAQDNTVKLKEMLLNEMLKTKTELKEKYGDIEYMKTIGKEKEKYCDELLDMMIELETKYNNILCIRPINILTDNLVDLCCCFCGKKCLRKLLKCISSFILLCKKPKKKNTKKQDTKKQDSNV